VKSRWLRVGLVVLALPQLQIGLWCLASPRSWYDNFPGGGHAWVAASGPYDEHLVRDVAAALLALGILLIWTAVTLAPALVRVALVAWLVFAVPHFVYHLVNHEVLPALDNAASLGGLLFEVLLPLALLVATLRPGHRSKGPIESGSETAARSVE